MKFDLKQQGENVNVFVDGEKITSFPNKTTGEVVRWVRNNISNAEIHTWGDKVNG